MKLLIVLEILVISFAIAPLASAFDGPSNGGGGNTVGDQLFDDYENMNSEALDAKAVGKLAAPVLADLDKKVPEFGKRLRQGLTGIVWYKEAKPLSQSGRCKNGAQSGLIQPSDQVIRACQNLYSVRIEKKWFETTLVKNPALITGLVVHELLVYQQLRSKTLTEESVLAVSRSIRKMTLTAEQLQAELKRYGFGNYSTLAQVNASAHSKMVSLYDHAVENWSFMCYSMKKRERGDWYLDTDGRFESSAENSFYAGIDQLKLVTKRVAPQDAQLAKSLNRTLNQLLEDLMNGYRLCNRFSSVCGRDIECISKQVTSQR